MGLEAVDGAESVQQAVGRRIGAGANVVKVFVDYRRRIMRSPPAQQHLYIPSVLHPPKEPNPDYLNFSQEELNMAVAEAALARCPTAAHFGTLEGAHAAINTGFDTIELVYFADEKLLESMANKGCIFVPTQAVAERLHKRRFPQILAQARLAYDRKVRLACGGDTGTFSPRDNARELELMVEAGIPVEDVLEACTVGGWETCRGDRCGIRFGWFEEGLRADIIALNKDPMQHPDALRSVDLVIKDAKMWKVNGKTVEVI